MGTWGGGLYDGDFASDLKALLGGLLRTPLSDDEILAEAWKAQGAGASDVDALDYWLVLADQLERHGIHHPDIFERACEIIERDEDLTALEALHGEPSTLAERRRATAKLLERLRNPRPAKKRRPIKAPQPLLFQPGDLIIWPTDRGRALNPFVAEDHQHLLGRFEKDGWGFGIISDAGHQLGVLAYLAVQVLMWRRPERPTPDLAIHCRRSDHYYGTIRPLHLQRCSVEGIGQAPLAAIGPALAPDEATKRARRAALEDVTLARAFGTDAFNRSVWPGKKFPYDAPSGTPLDPDEPDQRPGFWNHER